MSGCACNFSHMYDISLGLYVVSLTNNMLKIFALGTT